MALSNEMRRLTQGFLAAHKDRIAMVAAIRDDTAQELSGFHAAHEDMAVEQRRRLADYMYGLRDNVTKMLESLDTAHQRMAVDQRRRLADYADQLRDNVAKMLESLDTAHQSMAREQQRRLATGRTRLASDVSKMRGNLHADQSEARKVWSNFATVMRGRRAKKSGAPSPKAPMAKAARPPMTVAKAPVPHAVGEVIPDDLTTIGGIGAGRQQFLNEMGIYTFAQLAGSRPQKIRRVLGTSGRLANVEQWIEEARKRST